jgi:NAD(P)-dependent dehydrogenase (short-subunit alcohol dehydrogenase family)
MKLEPGQVAVVTGAASGLGRALAEQFAARGMGVMLADIEAAPLDDVVAAIRATGTSAIGVATDVTIAEQVDALAAATLDRFGRVDVVVHNAGVSSFPGPKWDYEVNDWEWVMGVNFGGVVHGVRAFTPHLVAQNSGHVVLTASMAGITSGPGLGPYMVSKHAVVGLAEGLAADLALVAPGVGVTVVCPGQMHTNIWNSGRNRPARLAVGTRELSDVEAAGMGEWMAAISGPEITAADAAAIVVDAIERGALHVAPNGSLAGVHARVERVLGDLADLADD